MNRVDGPVMGCMRRMRPVVTGSVSVICRRSPRASLNAPVRHAVSGSPSTASRGRSSVV
jgi:hypothetical protein